MKLMLSANFWIPCHTPASPETPTLEILTIQGYPQAKKEAWGTLRFTTVPNCQHLGQPYC